jgi:hypothetical protein
LRNSGISKHLAAIFKDYRKQAVLLAVVLGVITILSCLPYTPQGPFDARDYSRIASMKVEQHPWVELIEPLAAPFHVISGAPDFRVAGVCTLIWVFLGAGAWGMFAESRSRRRTTRARIVLSGIRRAFVATITLTLVVFFFVAARIPGWRLVVDNPDLIVADLHSHTVKSHDGLVSMETNLKWHEACGDSLVGLTEHDQLFAHEASIPAGSSLDLLPAVISGLEAHTGPQSMMALGLCGDPGAELQEPGAEALKDGTLWFSKQIHERCAGVVIVVTLNTLKTGDIARMVDAGVDGFEIVNSGHPNLRADLRRELLDASRLRGVVLVASSDWHGWGGMARTWTAVRAPGASAFSRAQRADCVMGKLREHDAADVIPVVAGFMGEPSLMRAILAPFAETVRYAQELSPARVVSWWVWVTALFFFWALLDRIGAPPGRVLPALLTGAAGLGLIVSGVCLIGQGPASMPFHVRVGLIAVSTGAVALAAALVDGLLIARKNR